jgi:hypothetical protein
LFSTDAPGPRHASSMPLLPARMRAADFLVAGLAISDNKRAKPSAWVYQLGALSSRSAERDFTSFLGVGRWQPFAASASWWAASHQLAFFGLLALTGRVRAVDAGAAERGPALRGGAMKPLVALPVLPPPPVPPCLRRWDGRSGRWLWWLDNFLEVFSCAAYSCNGPVVWTVAIDVSERFWTSRLGSDGLCTSCRGVGKCRYLITGPDALHQEPGWLVQFLRWLLG